MLNPFILDDSTTGLTSSKTDYSYRMGPCNLCFLILVIKVVMSSNVQDTTSPITYIIKVDGGDLHDLLCGLFSDKPKFKDTIFRDRFRARREFEIQLCIL